MEVRGTALTQQSPGSHTLHNRHVFCLPLRPCSSSCNNRTHPRESVAPLSQVSLRCRGHTSRKSTGKRCMADSGGYTMKWRRVNPNPWGVRRSSTVFGLGHENSSSGGNCIAGEPAEPLHSGDSFCGRQQREEGGGVK